MKPDDVTHCMRCSESLERGYSSRWSGEECKEVICFSCDRTALEELKVRVEVQLASLAIQEKIKEFEKRVWFGGLQEQVHAAKYKGYSAKLKTHNYLNVLTWTGIGRTMITIEDKDNSVSMVTEDGLNKESRMGMQGVGGKVNDILDLIDLAISLYENKTLEFKDDKEVSII